MSDQSLRPLRELQETGLLWLINRVVFHPRGFALTLHTSAGEVVGWSLEGDGAEAWVMGEGVPEDALLAKVRGLLGP